MNPSSLTRFNLMLIFLLSQFDCYSTECVNMDKCLCIEDNNVEYQCPREEAEITVTISPKNIVELQCIKNVAPFFDIDILPQLNLNNTSYFKLEYCYLNVSFYEIFKKFNMTNVKYLTFETAEEGNDQRIINVSKLLFEQMENLESLSLDYSTLNLSTDFLENTPNLKFISLTKDSLSQIDNYFIHVPKLEVLDLSRNQISFLPDNAFQNLRNLTRLYIWNNNLTGLTRNMFEDLENLEMLELSSNHIESIEKDTFSRLKNLVNISLRSNRIQNIDSEIFSNNKLMENIRLSYNPEMMLSQNVFANLTSLQTVELSFNNLQEIPENTFFNCYKLKELSLKGNRLSSISEKLFKGLKLLEKLDMSNNVVQGLPNKLFSSLVNLKQLYLNNNQISQLDNELFRNLAKLQILKLNDNRISFIGLQAFSSLSDSLTHLDLSNNRWDGVIVFNVGLESTPLNDCLNLEELILRNNTVKSIPELPALIKLKKLDLSFNHIRELTVSQFAHGTLDTFELDLTHNEIEHVNFFLAQQIAEQNSEPFDASDYSGANTIIYLDFNPISCDCSIINLVRYNNDDLKVLKTLVEIKQDKLACSNDKQLLVKNLSPHHVNCPVLRGCPASCSCTYTPYNTAIVVDCSFRNMTGYPQFFINDTNYNQTILNLSGNHLTHGPVKELNYDNITSLDLSFNRIEKMTWIPPYLKELNLRKNHLKMLTRDFIYLLKNRTSLEKIHLENNLWECNCEAWDLQKFLMQYYHKVNSSDVYCQDRNIQLVKLTDLDLCDLTVYLTILLPIVLSVLLCLAVAVAIYYRYQTEIKIYLYAKNLCLWFVTEEELDKDKTYDVFISYAHQDEKFVVDHLLFELEHGQTPFKVCIHMRDWVPGEFIHTQVVNSVKDSRRTLVVLSNNFVDSMWGKLEFRTAHTEALSEGRARVIVVIYGELDEDNLDDELKSYLKTNTYVKWGDKYFWNKLKYALPHSKRNFFKSSKHAKMMLKIDDKFDLIKSPPSSNNTSTPPITLDAKLLESKQINITIPNKVDGEHPLLK